MNTAVELELSARDRAILRAVGHGRAEIDGGWAPVLYIDGRCCSDQAAAGRLVRNGLVAAAGERRAPARLTDSGSRALAG